MGEALMLLAALAFGGWFMAKVIRVSWKATDPGVVKELRTQRAAARMRREREAQRRLEDE